jgi:hypothetical protein
MLVLGIARLLVDLAEVWTPTIDGAVEVAVAVGPAPAVGRVVLDRGVPRLEIEGEPHGRVLVTAEGLSSITIQLDGRGRAVVAPFEIPAETSEIRLRGVGSEQTSIPVPALPTPTSTRTQPPTQSATPTATAKLTATATSSPTRSAIDTPTPPPPTVTGPTLMEPTATT